MRGKSAGPTGKCSKTAVWTFGSRRFLTTPHLVQGKDEVVQKRGFAALWCSYDSDAQGCSPSKKSLAVHYLSWIYKLLRQLAGEIDIEVATIDGRYDVVLEEYVKAELVGAETEMRIVVMEVARMALKVIS